MERQTMEAEERGAEYYLDITKDTCPLTFVKTRLLIERMSSGATALIRLGAGEPLENVPRSVGELGHEILSVQAEKDGGDVFLLHLRKR
jgi:TusA-related sulfurtransferase